MQRMAHYSKACLVALREQTGIAYDHASRGVLQIFATEEQLTLGKRAARVLAEMDIPHRLVLPEELIAIEPALAHTTQNLAGGLHLPGDETGDCRLFCEQLAVLLRNLGCHFLFGTEVMCLERSGDHIVSALSSAGPIEADAFIVAAGPYAPRLLSPLGIHLPIYPVKGYSLTCEIKEEASAPRSSVMDEHSKVMITRLGSRIRAAGVAELAGFDPTIPNPAKVSLRNRVEALFPGGGHYGQASYWCGFRPMTPDGPARIGPAACKNLYINVGHGSNGWTQACGTSRVLADIVAGRRPEIEP